MEAKQRWCRSTRQHLTTPEKVQLSAICGVAKNITANGKHRTLITPSWVTDGSDERSFVYIFVWPTVHLACLFVAGYRVLSCDVSQP